MRRLVNTIRFLLLAAALACVAMASTNVTLHAHLTTHHHTCDSCEKHHDEHKDEEKTPFSDQDEICLTCQLLLGPGGKYLCIPFEPIECAANEALFTCNIDSQFIYQHNMGPLAARGPPVS